MEKIISKTPLYLEHKNAQAKISPFAGFNMPMSYPLGSLKEHLWCRAHVGLFDVSHMGQFILQGAGVEDFLSALTPTNFADKPLGKCVYSLLLNNKGGVVDDFIATRLNEEKIYMVINAACKEKDVAYIKEHLTQNITLDVIKTRTLIALQGPKAEMVLQKLTETNLSHMPFMTLREMNLAGIACFVSRSGYTGEDGFEISVDEKYAENIWKSLTESEWVEPVGLAARDTLRLEAGLPLYGQDITEETTPIEANLKWVLSTGHDGYIGCDIVQNQLQKGVLKKRVGIKLLEKGIARTGSKIFNSKGVEMGLVTSGGFGATVGCAISMGYVQTEFSKVNTDALVEVRGKKIKAQIVSPKFYKK